MYVPFRRRGSFVANLTPPQVIVVGFLLLIAIGTFLLSLPAASVEGRLSVVDALFTATSAVCVTGLVVVDTGSHFTLFGQIVILGLIQAGGLGIMAVSALMFLAMGRKIGLKERLVMQQALGSQSTAGVVRITRNIVIVTLVIEALGALLLTLWWSKEMPWGQAFYWGVFHSISAFNNAGFDITGASLRPFSGDAFTILLIAILVVLGGLGFFVIDDVWRRRRWENFSLHTRLVLVMTGGLLLLPTLVYLFMEHANPATLGPLDWYHKTVNAFFASVTARTAGFETVPTAGLRDSTLLMTMALMFIGGSPGGTAGGIRTNTFAMIGLVIRATARGKEEIELFGRRLPKLLVDKAITIAAISLAFVIVVTAVLLVTEEATVLNPASKITFIHVMFDSVSAVGTVGLSTGLTPELTPLGRVLTVVAMFVGRVGPLTLAVALAQRRMRRSPIHYPEDRVIIG
jgi:trk system potassium uptake protein TrkH